MQVYIDSTTIKEIQTLVLQFDQPLTVNSNASGGIRIAKRREMQGFSPLNLNCNKRIKVL
jgi:hypothetical protein